MRLKFVEGESDDTSDEKEPHGDDVGGEAGQHVLVRQDVEDSDAFASFQNFGFNMFNLGLISQTLLYGN